MDWYPTSNNTQDTGSLEKFLRERNLFSFDEVLTFWRPGIERWRREEISFEKCLFPTESSEAFIRLQPASDGSSASDYHLLTHVIFHRCVTVRESIFCEYACVSEILETRPHKNAPGVTLTEEGNANKSLYIQSDHFNRKLPILKSSLKGLFALFLPNCKHMKSNMVANLKTRI